MTVFTLGLGRDTIYRPADNDLWYRHLLYDKLWVDCRLGWILISFSQHQKSYRENVENQFNYPYRMLNIVSHWFCRKILLLYVIYVFNIHLLHIIWHDGCRVISVPANGSCCLISILFNLESVFRLSYSSACKWLVWYWKINKDFPKWFHLVNNKLTIANKKVSKTFNWWNTKIKLANAEQRISKLFYTFVTNAKSKDFH